MWGQEEALPCSTSISRENRSRSAYVSGHVFGNGSAAWLECSLQRAEDGWDSLVEPDGLAVENRREECGLSLPTYLPADASLVVIRESGRGGGVFCSLFGPVWVVVTEDPKSLLGISHRRRWLSTKLDPKRRTPILSPTSLPLKPGSGQLDGRRKANSDAVEKRGPFSADQNRPRKCPKKPKVPACCSSRTTTPQRRHIFTCARRPDRWPRAGLADRRRVRAVLESARRSHFI